MSQTEDLLNSLSATDISAYSSDSSAEPHIVIGSDRIITVPDSLKRIAVQYDHNVETVTFDCPRYWDERDLSQLTIFINYKLPNGVIGAYRAENVMIDNSDQNIIHFNWGITSNVTQIKGKIEFLVCAKTVDSSGNEVIHWNSELDESLYVSEGLECNESIIEEHPDLITQIFETTDESVRTYLNEHPELTTTLQDGEIAYSKLNTPLKSKISYLTPQMYGAKGDGISDDTSAVQAALNTGQSVYIPKGVYKVGKLIMSNGKGARIYGDGCGNTILKHNDDYISDDCVIQISEGSNCILSSFSIVGGGSGIIDNGTYTGTKYHGIIVSNCSDDSENIIENIDIYKCLGNGLHLSNSSIGCRISNIHTYYNVGCGLCNEGYGNKVVNLDTHQNHSDGIRVWAGGFNGTNIKSWGNLRDGINMDNMWSHIAAVVLSNVSVQQNGRHGLMMTNCESCVITSLQSLANNYKSKSKLDDGETLYSKTAGLLMADGNHNNYIQGNIISSYAYWNSFEENSVRIAGKDNTNNVIDLTVNSSLIGPDMYDVCFKPLSYTDSNGNNHKLYNYNKLPEYSILRQAYSNPLNTIKINGEVVADKTMTNVANNNISNESFMKKSDGTTNVISVSSDISSGILSLTLSDYADLSAYGIDNISNADSKNIDVSKVAYRRGYSLQQIKNNTNKVLYLRFTAKVSEYKAFGTFPLVQINYKRSNETSDKWAYLDDSSDYVKSNIIFNTDYITKYIALDLSDYVPYDIKDKNGNVTETITTNITIYFRLCAMKLSSTKISGAAISDTAIIDVKELSYKLS